MTTWIGKFRQPSGEAIRGEPHGYLRSIRVGLTTSEVANILRRNC